jgi:plasmid maintenance system antidote protein VapI
MKKKHIIQRSIRGEGYSDRDIAKLLEMTPQNLSNQINNKTIKYELAEKIAALLGKEIVWVDKRANEA